jgi:transcriptional regulator with XRE-family HTH domain
VTAPNRQPRLWQPTLSESLREAIRTSGLTVYRLAKLAGTAPAVITRFLRGERDLRLSTVEKIAEVLNLTLVQRSPAALPVEPLEIPRLHDTHAIGSKEGDGQQGGGDGSVLDQDLRGTS